MVSDFDNSQNSSQKLQVLMLLNLYIRGMETYYFTFHVNHCIPLRIYKPEGEREFRKT